MLKYYNAMVVFEEIPDEITLAINITNCPCKCPGCHSKFLWEDIGTELTEEELHKLISKNDGITTICFMGGDSDPKEINRLAKSIFMLDFCNHTYKIGWYSGKDELSNDIELEIFDYIKLGHYDDKFGPLNKETTNQHLYKVINGELKDITEKFWKKATR